MCHQPQLFIYYKVRSYVKWGNLEKISEQLGADKKSSSGHSPPSSYLPTQSLTVLRSETGH